MPYNGAIFHYSYPLPPGKMEESYLQFNRRKPFTVGELHVTLGVCVCQFQTTQTVCFEFVLRD